MEFQIGNKVITTPMDVLLHRLQFDLKNGKLHDIKPANGQNIRVTCPHHKDGYERNPSCDVFTDRKDPYTTFGVCHCFSCGFSATLDKFVNECFNETGDFGKQWLLENCETAFVSEVEYLPEIVLPKKKVQEQGEDLMDESSLLSYNYYHEYMWKRKLSKEIVDLFEVGYDPERQTLVFPVRDEQGRLRFITRRSVNKHLFMIPPHVEKPVYLLYYILQNNITSVAVAESQINALVSWSYGLPAIALFGTGSKKQYEILRRSGVTDFILLFDGDNAGRKGAKRFIENMPQDRFITDVLMPPGKDVGDCSYEEFWNLVNYYKKNSIV